MSDVARTRKKILSNICQRMDYDDRNLQTFPKFTDLIDRANFYETYKLIGLKSMKLCKSQWLTDNSDFEFWVRQN